MVPAEREYGPFDRSAVGVFLSWASSWWWVSLLQYRRQPPGSPILASMPDQMPQHMFDLKI